MHNRSFLICVLVIGLLAVTGCRPDKLNDVSTVTIDDSNPAKSRDLSPQKLPQKITVEFTVSGNEVSVLVFKQEDAEDLVFAKEDKALGKAIKSMGDKFTVDVPPNTATRVVVRNLGKSAEVKLKLTN